MEEIGGIQLKLPDKGELRQRHIEDFYAHMRQVSPLWRSFSLQELVGAYARFAAKSGWMELTEAQIGDLEPWKTKQIAIKVDTLISEALAIPKG